MTSLSKGFLGIIFGLSLASQAQAATTLMEANDWKVQMGGFLETDLIVDSTRSFNESTGNAPVALPGTAAGENGRTLLSARHSRLSFTVTPPVQDDWKSRGYLEMDFMGYEPSSAPATGVSEAGFYSNPTLRFRHANFTAEKDGWTFLAGQSWSLFGWQPNYVVATVSVTPGPGILYQRTTQFALLKAMNGDTSTLQAGLAIARPTQRDSNMPNIDVGARWALNNYRSGFSSATGDVKAESLSVGLSGTFRQFVASDTAVATSALNKTNSSAFAADVLLPIIPANDKDTSYTMTLTGEYSNGTGYGDELPGWSGAGAGYTGDATGGSQATNTNLDQGIGTLQAGKLELVKLQTMSAQLQFHFAAETGMFVSAGYSQTSSSNAKDLGGKYDKTDMTFVNVFKDFTKQIRVAAEYSKYKTSYTVTGDAQERSPENNRYMLTTYFRF